MKKHLEDDLQLACVRWFEMQYPVLSKALHHSPNGGRRNVREGARFKAQGVRPGFPDLVLYHRSPPFSLLAVELKIKPNKPTKDQKWWLHHLQLQNAKTAECYSLEEFIEVVKGYLRYEC